MIRVLHSVSNLDRAGIETMLMNYYRHIDRDKVQFDFICNKKKPGAYDEEVKRLGGNIYHSPGLNPAKMFKYNRFMKNLIEEHPEYQIVEAHNGAFGVYALHGAKLCGIPNRIFHAHGASITKDWKMPLKIICKKFLPSNITHCYTCGTAAARFYFGDEIVDSGKYEFIPNAIEVKRFIFNEDIRNGIREKYGLQDKHVLGHVGRFMTQKNHAFLLDIFAKLVKKDEKAILVLLGDGELMTAMKEKAKNLNISDKILFIGNVGNANEWYQAFDAFILPSIWEGLPVVGVEAQAADLPCVFSDTITREIGFSEDAEFISLEASKDKWVQAIEKGFEKKQRVDKSNLIRENNYDIETEAGKLQARYLKLAGVKE
ncbi:Glycosyltransferase involved in cell wall bisynthesis [Butyrivibrio sp. ob235]|uniref:glycosyltransferase family 1 protein n=1 Tax=Butyrivibrio sp. ob235 TaxID=1761780 RepID=UPI0008C2114B|nr:glycosyltransferase family 1 protein [Butyrivibrio sp. ob235]SEL72592.1 Glycosyltransferase involved in cell wall bisynthesis [Butyrivibrio sp. ob235]